MEQDFLELPARDLLGQTVAAIRNWVLARQD